MESLVRRYHVPRPRPALPALPPIAAAVLLLAACSTAEAPGTDVAPADTAAATATATPTRVAVAEGFRTPESVLYDPELDVYFVSNIDGAPGDRDGNGFISRVLPNGTVDSLRFIAGGRGGVVLNAPKGLARSGDTLWVTDIDAVRAFHRRTGAPLRTHDLAPVQALFLNDIAIGAGGALHVTDTGIRITASGIEHPGPDRVFRIAGDSVTVAMAGDSLQGPNGITWDAAGARFVLVPFAGQRIGAWDPAARRLTTIATGPGQFDGVEVLADGRILVTSWADSAVHVVRDGAVTRLVTGVPSPADIGVDTRRMRVAVPLFQANRLELWTIPRP